MWQSNDDGFVMFFRLQGIEPRKWIATMMRA